MRKRSMDASRRSRYGGGVLRRIRDEDGCWLLVDGLSLVVVVVVVVVVGVAISQAAVW